MNRIDLAGRRAVITGGAQGIGRAIAERFLESGASVSVWDRNQAATDATVQELSGHGSIHGLVVEVTDAQRVGEASAYSAAKAGVIALTKSLGKELAKFDIGVNCVTPAAARTGLFEQMTESHIRYMLSKIPRDRFVDVGEIASMVAWLVSAENSFTTGAVFDISGGRATY